MDQQQALAYIRGYFHQLFDLRNIDALDGYLDADYFDDDIGDPNVDHIQNSKDYLRDWFKKNPGVGVEVVDAMTRDNVITTFLEWFQIENGARKTIMKGIANFVLKNKKIIKRHTFIYLEK